MTVSYQRHCLIEHDAWVTAVLQGLTNDAARAVLVVTCYGAAAHGSLFLIGNGMEPVARDPTQDSFFLCTNPWAPCIEAFPPFPLLRRPTATHASSCNLPFCVYLTSSNLTKTLHRTAREHKKRTARIGEFRSTGDFQTRPQTSTSSPSLREYRSYILTYCEVAAAVL